MVCEIHCSATDVLEHIRAYSSVLEHTPAYTYVRVLGVQSPITSAGRLFVVFEAP